MANPALARLNIPSRPFWSSALRRPILAAITLACVLLNGVAYVLYEKSETISDAKMQVSHSFRILEQAKTVFSGLQDVETGQRGFLLTGQENFLEPYNNATSLLDRQFAKLRQLVEDNPLQQPKLGQLNRLMMEQRRQLARQIAERRASRSSDPVTLTEIGDAKRLMDDIRVVAASILQEAHRRLLDRQEIERASQENYDRSLFASAGLSTIGVIFSYCVAIFIGMRRREAEAKYRESEERFRLASEGIRDGIFDYQVADGTIYYAPKLKEMLGYSDAEMPNTLEEFNKRLHPDDAETAWAVMHKYFNREMPEYVNFFRLRHKDGSYRWIMARGAGIWNAEGKIQRLIGAHTDLTDQKEAEASLQRLNKELETFTYIASHDLRSPLVNLKGFASEMKRGIDTLQPMLEAAMRSAPPEQQETARQILLDDMPTALRFIHSSVEKMDRLTSTILELSRIGRRELKLEFLDVGSIVERCLNSLHHQLDERGITVEVDPLPNIVADPLSIEQTFGNIIDNAIKYGAPGRPGRIEIGAIQRTNETTFWVKDNGRGIAPQDQKKVFEIFRRAGNTRNIPGEGMGMAYVKANLRRLGGDIWCESALGEGTTFYFSVSNRLDREKLNG